MLYVDKEVDVLSDYIFDLRYKEDKKQMIGIAWFGSWLAIIILLCWIEWNDYG